MMGVLYYEEILHHVVWYVNRIVANAAAWDWFDKAANKPNSSDLARDFRLSRQKWAIAHNPKRKWKRTRSKPRMSKAPKETLSKPAWTHADEVSREALSRLAIATGHDFDGAPWDQGEAKELAA
jgi:hypothetical protein